MRKVQLLLLLVLWMELSQLCIANNDNDPAAVPPPRREEKIHENNKKHKKEEGDVISGASTRRGPSRIGDWDNDEQDWGEFIPLSEGNYDACIVQKVQNAVLLGGNHGNYKSNEGTTTYHSIDLAEPILWSGNRPSLPLRMNGMSSCTISPEDGTIYITTAGTSTPFSTGREVYFLPSTSSSASSTGPWVVMASPMFSRGRAALVAMGEKKLFLFGGETSGGPLSKVEIYSPQLGWRLGTAMPQSTPDDIGYCDCASVRNVASSIILLFCIPCIKIHNGTLPLTTFRFNVTSLSFVPDHSGALYETWMMPVSTTAFLSFRAIGLSHYVLLVISASTSRNPLVYMYDQFSWQIHFLNTRLFSEQRSKGALFVSLSRLYLTGGICPNGTALRAVDNVYVIPGIIVDINYRNRTYYVNDFIKATTLRCLPGQLMRLATSPDCLEKAAGTSDAMCVPNNQGESDSFILVKNPSNFGYLCMSNGYCPQTTSQRTPCSFNPTKNGKFNLTFERCLFSQCCWDYDLQKCYNYVETAKESERFFYNVDLRTITVLPLPTPAKPGFFSTFAGIASVCCVAVAIVAFCGYLFYKYKVATSALESREGSNSPSSVELNGRYKILSKLGQGGFGTVFLVRRNTDQGQFALKYIACSNDEERRFAMVEFELVRNAQGHPNMVKLIDMFMSWQEDSNDSSDNMDSINANPSSASTSRGGSRKKKKKSNSFGEQDSLLQTSPRYVCIVTDYFPEGDLSNYILTTYRRGCPEYFVLHVLCKQLCTLLRHLQALTPPLVHRDLKPENILLAQNASKIVVTDFGLAKQMDNSFMTTRAGSLHYVAPECWKKHYTSAVDMWGVGCIMYAASTGRVTAQTARIMFNDAKDPGFERDVRYDLRKYSPFFVDVVIGLLKVEPAERLTPSGVLKIIEDDQSPVTPSVGETYAK